MSLFNFSQEELLCFFAVLVRYGTLMAVLPFVGDRAVPGPIKVFLALGITIALYPALVHRGQIQPASAMIWGASAGGIVGVVAMEAIFGLIMGFIARMIFDTVTFGGNLVGNFMGFAAASTFDPHQETQTQVVSQLQLTIAMLIFLVVDGHHVMLRASLDSYRIVGLGGANILNNAGINSAFSQRIIEISGQVVRFGIQLAAPIAISMFAVNVAFGVIAKSMPQLNILVLSFAASAIVGLVVMLLGMPEFSGAVSALVSKMGDWMEGTLQAMATGK